MPVVHMLKGSRIKGLSCLVVILNQAKPFNLLIFLELSGSRLGIYERILELLNNVEKGALSDPDTAR